MPTYVIGRVASSGSSGADGSDTPAARMTLTAGEIEVSVPYAPRNVSYDNRGLEWTEQARPGRAPLLTTGTERLSTIAYDLMIATTDSEQTVESVLVGLERMANSKDPITVSYGPREAGLWRMTKFSYASTQRHPDTNQITQASATIELTRASDAGNYSIPVKGGGGKGGGKGGRTYKVKKGDTLVKISQKFYKTPKHWRYIAKVNKIRNPKRKGSLKVGRKLKIPKLKKG